MKLQQFFSGNTALGTFHYYLITKWPNFGPPSHLVHSFMILIISSPLVRTFKTFRARYVFWVVVFFLSKSLKNTSKRVDFLKCCRFAVLLKKEFFLRYFSRILLTDSAGKLCNSYFEETFSIRTLAVAAVVCANNLLNKQKK